MKVFVTADHGGFEFKNAVYEHLVHQGVDVEDLGPETLDPEDDYPDYVFKATGKVLGSDDKDARAIIACRSGQGVGIAANRAAGIRAAVVWNEETAKKSREHNNANVLCLSGDNVDLETNLKIVDAWLKEPYSKEERHQRRLDKIEHLYG